MHPFAELTNRTPSPSQKKDDFGRKHSPWTAARHKKKTRAVDEQQQAVDEVPVYQQAIPEAYESPAAREKTAGASAGYSLAEYSLAHSLSPGSSATTSPHCSPPINKGSAEGAELHPSKAYLQDPQACASASSMDLGSAGGVDLAAAAGHARGTSRSPVWFCSSNTELLQEETHAAGASTVDAGQHRASSSAPASGNLFDRFDQVARQQQQQQHQLPPLPQQQPPPQQSCMLQQALHQQQCAVGRQGPAARGRRLTARRGSGNGSSSSGGGGGGGSLLDCTAPGGESSSCHWLQQQQLVDTQTAAAATGTAAACADAACLDNNTDCGFQLHSRLGQVADTDTTRRRSFGSCGLQQRLWCGEETRGGVGSCLGGVTATRALQGGSAGGGGDADAGECAEEGTGGWFEEQMQQAADEGDMESAQQLWGSLQAAGLPPSRRFMNTFLICCHYGGADPVTAQEVVRDMCAAADMEPDGFAAQLLASIDIGWQQLHCTDASAL